MNTTSAPEQVLVIPRTILDNIGSFQGFSNSLDYLSAFIDSGELKFVDRERAEQDTSLKQIIPYTVVLAPDSKGILPFSVLQYVRGFKGGEPRLHDQRSIGYGGHINPCDQHGESFQLGDFTAAVHRELTEELAPFRRGLLEVIGFVNDDSNPVGEVHFGVVSLLHARSADELKDQDDNTSAGVKCPLDLLLHYKLETWADMTLRAMIDAITASHEMLPPLLLTMDLAWQPKMLIDMTPCCKGGAPLMIGHDAASNMRRIEMQGVSLENLQKLFTSAEPVLWSPSP